MDQAVKLYKIKHIPTGLWAKPASRRSPNLTTGGGKIYQKRSFAIRTCKNYIIDGLTIRGEEYDRKLLDVEAQDLEIVEFITTVNTITNYGNIV